MSKLRINREQLVSDVCSFPLLRSWEKEVTEATEIVTKEYGLENTHVADDRTFVGIEVEVEGITRVFEKIKPFWTTKEDGSLRNNGLELVSLPIRGRAIPAALEILSRELRDVNPKHDFSERTSVHVHVNVRDISVEALFNYLLTYLVFETAIYKVVFDFCGKKRDENIFCVPIQESGDFMGLRSALDYLERGRNQDALSHLHHGWKKYSGLNLVPVTTFGTVEFRHMGGTSNSKRLLSWINILLSMKEFACGVSYDTLTNRIMELNTNSLYESFTKEVFSHQADNILRYNVKEELERGVNYVKTMLAEEDWEDKVKIDEKFDGSGFSAFFKKKGIELVPLKPEDTRDPKELTDRELDAEYLRLGAVVAQLRVNVERVGNELDEAIRERDIAQAEGMDGVAANLIQEVDNLYVEDDTLRRKLTLAQTRQLSIQKEARARHAAKQKEARV